MVKTIRNLYGTNFQGADLTGAIFRRAHIRHTTFANAKIDYLDWEGADFITPYFDPGPVTRLLITRDGYRGDYTNAYFENDILSDVRLRHANLSGANLSGANLTGADLRDATLTAVKAGGADFSGADLTGATLEAWGITKNTRFTGVRCDHLYLRESRDIQSRKPLSGSFHPGDFEKIVGYLTDALDFILHTDDDHQAWVLALKKLMATHGEGGLEPAGFQHLDGGDRLFTFKTPPGFDNAAAHTATLETYETLRLQLATNRAKVEQLTENLQTTQADLTETKLELKARTNELSAAQDAQVRFLQQFMCEKIPNPADLSQDKITLHNPRFSDSTSLMSKPSITNSGSGDLINTNAGRDIGVAGKDQQGIAGRDLSGQVQIAIDKLRHNADNADAPTLADLLTQLNDAIATSDLNEKSKTQALRQVQKLTDAAQQPTADGVKEAVEDSTTLLKTITGAIPTLWTAINGVLRAIGTCMGFDFEF